MFLQYAFNMPSMFHQWLFNQQESEGCGEMRRKQREERGNMTNTAKRHIKTDKRTTIQLETAFWNLIEQRAEATGQTWKQWAVSMLEGKPEGVNAASWLRVCSIQGEGQA